VYVQFEAGGNRSRVISRM